MKHPCKSGTKMTALFLSVCMMAGALGIGEITSYAAEITRGGVAQLLQ